MEIFPSTSEYSKKLEVVNEAFSRIPDPPANFKQAKEAARALTFQFDVLRVQRMQIDRMMNMDGTEETAREWKEARQELKKKIAFLEDMIQ